MADMHDENSLYKDLDYMQIFRQGPDGEIIVDGDSDWVIRDITDRYGEMTGTNRKDIVGHPLLDIFPETEESRQWKTLRKTFEQALETKQLQTMNTIRYDIEINGKMTPMFWRGHSRPIIEGHDARFVIHRVNDVTELVKENRILEFSSEKVDLFKLIINNIKDYSIIMLDTQGIVRTWNEGAKRLIQYDAFDVIGKHFAMFFTQEDQNAGIPDKELETVRREGRIEIENWRVRKDGSIFWADVVTSGVFNKEGHLLGYVKVIRDLTEKKDAEQKTIQAFQESSKLKAEFLANMSHEIRTPMNGIMSAAHLLKDTRLSQEQKELVDILMQSGTTMVKLTNDILDYSKLESDRVTLVMEPFNLCEEIRSTQSNFEKAIINPVKMYLSISSNVPCWVKGDRLRLHQVLSNLMDNAVKFTPRGKIETEVTMAEESLLQVSISDTGIGISETDMKRLFQPFSQLEAFATKRHQGSGLGLAICKRLVEMMGGTISAKSILGEGSTFTFTVKIEKTTDNFLQGSASTETGAVQTASQHIPEKDAADTTILIAEDNEINQNVVKRILKKLGYEKVLIAQNGQQAVDMFIEHQPDIILMDIQMPVMDGITATQEIRKLNRDVPIIAMTANALKGDAEKSLEAGMTGYIPKPIKIPVLAKMLSPGQE